MAFLKVTVTRTSDTWLYIEVPDDFTPSDIYRQEHAKRLGEIAKTTTQEYDWDMYDWEGTVEAQDVGVVTEEEARRFKVAKLKASE